MLQTPSLFKKMKLPFAAGLLLAVFGVLAISGLAVQKVHADRPQDCDSNAIMYCGFSSSSNFTSKAKANASGNGHNDLVAIYSHFGLESSEYDRFVKSARTGTAYKDGRIVVDGQTVGTNGRSIGRLEGDHNGSGMFTEKVGSETLYGNSTNRTFNSDSIPVTVLFNAKGQVEFAVLQSCGNPELVTPVTPSYSCNALSKTAVSGKANTYSFTTSASAGNNASIAKLVYSFGDGTTTTTTSPGTAVTHTYTKAGSFTAKVTVYVNLPGNQQVTVTSSHCETPITVVIPFEQCVQLTGAILDQSKYSYSFTATAKYGNGAQLVSADFTFGDGKSQTGVKQSTATTITVSHTYAAAGKYDVAAMLHFTANGQAVTAPTCLALVTPTAPPTPECKPGVPVGDARCTPCQYDSSLPSDSDQCVAPLPPELPNTGAGNTIAIFSAIVVAAFLGYRQLLFRKHKAAFAAAQMGTSALPLADPLNQDAPLTGTPLETKRRGLRRKRQF